MDEQVCLRIQLRKFKRVLNASELLIRTEVITKTKETILSRESVARLSQAHYVVEGANLVETNTEVNYLLTSFLYHFFTDSTFFWVIILSYFQCVSWTYEKEKL
jgi:cytochrome c oxidase subunit 3